MTFLALFAYIPSGEGFGFNGNILETNLINLSVVIAVVVSFGGDALRSLLDDRKQTILNNLQEADLKAKEAENKVKEFRKHIQKYERCDFIFVFNMNLIHSFCIYIPHIFFYSVKLLPQSLTWKEIYNLSNLCKILVVYMSVPQMSMHMRNF